MSQKNIAKSGNGKKKEVAIINSMFAEDAGVGLTNLGSDDLAMPMLKLLQKTSSELDELDDARSGDIYNTVTKEAVKGKEGVCVINCAYSLQYIEWEPRGTGSGAPFNIYSAGDTIPATHRGIDDNKDYVVDGNGRYIERTAQHYLLVLNKEGMTQEALLAMKATQYKKSKGWNSAMKSVQLKDSNGKLFIAPRFSHTWNLTTAKEENKHGDWYGWIIEKDKILEDQNLYGKAKLFAESIKIGQVKVQHVREDDSLDDEIPF